MDIIEHEANERAEQERLTFKVFDQWFEMTKELILARAESKHWLFFTCDDLHRIASEEMVKSRVRWEDDLNETEAVYIFTDLVHRSVLKIGECDNMRRRLVRDHLRYGNVKSVSTVCDHYRSRGSEWPQPLLDDQITLIVIPLPNSSKPERLALEGWLQAKLIATLK